MWQEDWVVTDNVTIKINVVETYVSSSLRLSHSPTWSLSAFGVGLRSVFWLNSQSNMGIEGWSRLTAPKSGDAHTMPPGKERVYKLVCSSCLSASNSSSEVT